ncbi:MAG: signal peptide peptidase SppA [Desulfobacteraceae bacterium]|nr:MAG: signal peptide peptidase SppA [Desulfobacteraceae bacterium]
MFSRRHPILFFLLSLTLIITVFLTIFTGILVMGTSMFSSGLIASQGDKAGNIGVVEIKGFIGSPKKWIQDIKTFRDNDRIKAIVLRINSPGGGIGPSQEIYREVIKTRKIKEVVTSMGSVAASGGYYIAAASDKIMANKGTITGSIGVIMEYANISEAIKKIGLAPIVIKSGEFKDVGSPFRDLEESEKVFLQEVVDELHLQFVEDVSHARGIPVEELTPIADGRILTGNSAMALNLVDRIGNLDDAVQWAGQLAGIQGEAIPVYPAEDTMGWLRKMTTALFKDLNITGPVSDNFRFVVN